MRKMYFVTGLAVLAVSASMFTGCGSQTIRGSVSADSEHRCEGC